MGQFGKKIQAEQIPGWSEYYLDYKGLKKIVGSLRNTTTTGSSATTARTAAVPGPIAPGGLARPSGLFSPRSSTPRARGGQPLLWDAGVPPRVTTPLPTTPAFAASSTGDEDRGQEFQMVKASFFFKLQRELDKVGQLHVPFRRETRLTEYLCRRGSFQINTFYLQKEAELKLRLATLVSKQRSAATRVQPELEEETTATKDLVEWRAVEEGFRLLQNDLLKLQVCAHHTDPIQWAYRYPSAIC
jgi:CDK inhibitor PHO81